ncbi:MAG TPA: S53 family peptidase [Candidatus Koribacter sp.]
MRCHARVLTDDGGRPFEASGPVGYSPHNLRMAYGLSPWGKSTTTIAIVDAYDDPNIESDLAVYSKQYGLPSCTTANGCFKKVNQSGGKTYPAKNAGWALEIALDVEIAHAMCPNCKILLVEASTTSLTNLFVAEDYAAAHATVVSNSWGATEFTSETSSSYDGHFSTHTGKPFIFSAGDNGYGVSYPAASKYVTAVGGTTLKLTNNSGYSSETVWNGTGSGCSAYEGKPSWQTDTKCIRRTVADVAADADPFTGAAIYDTVTYEGSSGWFTVGGTSLSTPIIAGVYAIAGNAASTIDGSYPYAHRTYLHDVKSGNNGSCGSYLCTGESGFDGPTGLGTPKTPGAF